ncbi:hypothetical protein Scel_62520 [Streptomyces cellostaticus]|nr:hypothetical protein Scel_62520 [Streptomyces cellostaticus]
MSLRHTRREEWRTLEDIRDRLNTAGDAAWRSSASRAGGSSRLGGKLGPDHLVGAGVVNSGLRGGVCLLPLRAGMEAGRPQGGGRWVAVA